jgi:hypothetical protein
LDSPNTPSGYYSANPFPLIYDPTNIAPMTMSMSMHQDGSSSASGCGSQDYNKTPMAKDGLVGLGITQQTDFTPIRHTLQPSASIGSNVEQYPYYQN